MDKSLQRWVLEGAKAPTPVEYDLAFIRELCHKHSINLLFYIGNLPDLVLEESKDLIKNLVFLDNSLNVNVRVENSSDIVVKDFQFVYRYIQGSKHINFIDYSQAQKPNMQYVVNRLWESCYDGSVLVIKNADKFLSDLGIDLEWILDKFNSFKNKCFYTVRNDLDQIIIEKE